LIISEAMAEWTIPAQPPVVQTNYISSPTTEPLLLTAAACQDNYVVTGRQQTVNTFTRSFIFLATGSSSGCLWIIDKRMGKVLNAWNALEGPILKVVIEVDV